jgi:hypothetical protein
MITITSRDAAILSFINTVTSGNMFAFVARTDTAWPVPATPPSRDTTVESDFDTEIAFLKRLDISNYRFMITRNNWAAGAYTAGAFVMTTDFNVYRCSTTGTSTTKPVHQSGTVADNTTSWEFIRQISADDQTRFLTSTRVPLTIASDKYFFSTTLLQSIKISFDFVGSEDGKLSLARQFRVVGLYANPLYRGDKTDTYANKTTVKDYGTPLTWNTIVAGPRVEEQVDTHTFDIIIPN